MIKTNFHHVHLNVVDMVSTLNFYQKYFLAKQVKYRGMSDALLLEKSFILLSSVDEIPLTNEGSSLWHIGWSGVDGTDEFNWRVKEGIKVHTEVTPLGSDHWMYFWGPSNEVIEVFTGNKNYGFEHVHLLSSDVDATMEWFRKYLGLVPENSRAVAWNGDLFKWNHLWVGDVNIFVYGKPIQDRHWFPDSFKPTAGSAIDHIGFSVANIDLVYEKMKADQLDVEDVRTDLLHGVRSFFVGGPDGLLIEIVQSTSEEYCE